MLRKNRVHCRAVPGQTTEGWDSAFAREQKFISLPLISPHYHLDLQLNSADFILLFAASIQSLRLQVCCKKFTFFFFPKVEKQTFGATRHLSRQQKVIQRETKLASLNLKCVFHLLVSQSCIPGDHSGDFPQTLLQRSGEVNG